MSMVTMYTGQRCAACRTIKMFLQRKGVEYIEKDTDSNRDFFVEMNEKYGVTAVPVTVIDDEPVIGPNLSMIMQKIKA